jgi:ectoine hydroxylase-related dioxygenase (phytanoyl-CoA dioxygenase family)
VKTSSEVVRRGVLDQATIAALGRWVTDVETWPAGSHVWGHYAEQTPTGTAICRTENVSACHTGVAALVEGELRELAADALGEPVAAFKDKLNYKRPGGAGFSPHQDRRAYPGVDRVVSLLVAVDECSAKSGCLWLADGVEEPLPTDERGVVRADVCEDLDWAPAELAPGDAVCIDGLVPHYSEANRSRRPRRVLVASYAPTREGYGRDHYYAARQVEMTSASARDGQFRISTLADFEGAEVATGVQAVERCTHG